jgi:gamma-glutamylcyclotransferase (GGCT)/AIG2-like uncharacterized protein YtfP
MQPNHIAVYGTLMRGFGANSKLNECEFVSVGTIKGTLYYAGFPYFLSDPVDGNDCVCEVYKLPDDPQVRETVLNRLDSYEGVPHHYTRETIDANVAFGKVPCYVYEPVDKQSVINRCPVIESNCYRTRVANRNVGY